MPQKFDVVVVGAGVAGLAAAYKTASAGLSVLVIERGDYPGAKNVMGGVFYTAMMDDLIPDFWKEAPLERPVVEQRFWLMDQRSAVSIGYKSEDWAQEPHNCYTVFRGQFDKWFADKCIEVGATIVNETVVESCIVEDGAVVGVRTGRPQGDVYADVVVLADGVNSLLAKQLGFHDEWRPEQVALTVMEVLKLPGDIIEERFNLNPGMGASIEMYGDATLGMVGTAFLYTNKEHISIGVGALLNQIRDRGAKPYQMLEYVKNHPMVKPLIKGAEPVEYYAHLIPEGGYNAVPELVGNGVVLVGDAAQLVNGIHREGSNLAITSGRLAGEAIIHAKQMEDFSIASLAGYPYSMSRNYVVADLKKYKDAYSLLGSNPKYLEKYIPGSNMAFHEFLTVDGVSKKDKQALIMKKFLDDSSLFSTFWEMSKLWKVMK